MKKHSRIISILLAIMMVMTSLSLVFAVDELTAEPQADDQAVVTEETAPEAEETPSDTGEAAPEAGEPAPAAEEAAPETDETVEELSSEQKDAGSSTIDKLVHGLEKPIITVTINYVYKSGGEAAPSVSQEIELKENSKGVYEGKYSVKSPMVVGYKADKAIVEGTLNAQSKNPTVINVTYSPAEAQPVKNLRLHPSYKSIVLTWDRVGDAKYYVVQRSLDGSKYSDVKTIRNTSASQFAYTDTTANGTTGQFNQVRTYYYRVLTISYTDIRANNGAKVSGTCVRPMYESITFKSSATLSSHRGKNQTVTFKGGQTVIAQGFGGGKYMFWYNGSEFWTNYIRVKNCKADYQANKISKSKSYSGIWARQNYASASGVTDNYQGILFYDKISAESFVNSYGRSSKTKYLIWVSTYTQHVYVFQGSKGNWKLIKDWECATGAGESPTPTGDKELERYVRYRHGVNWWRPFQTWNSIHGKLSSWEMGGPASNGCVRNFDPNAKFIYDNCPNGTALIVW